MQVVILAGGLGTRIRSIAPDTPKSLIPVCGEPFVYHQLRLLQQEGFRDVLMCVGYRGEQIVDAVGSGDAFGLRVEYAHEDPDRLLGTGGALVQARPQLATAFLTLYGDSYLPVSYREVVQAFARAKKPAIMTVYRNEDRWDPSNVEFEDGEIVRYEKGLPPGSVPYIDYGLSGFRREIIERYADSILPLDLAHIQRDLVQAGEMAGHEVHRRFYEIGKPEGLADLEAHFHGENEADEKGEGYDGKT